MPFVSFADVIAELDHVDDPDVLERARKSTAVHIALEMTRPRNWWGTHVEPDALFAVARKEGIPVAWVPEANNLAELAGAPDSAGRRQVLRKRQAEVIIEDCVRALAECSDPWLADHATLARRAIATYQAGYHEAAMWLWR